MNKSKLTEIMKSKRISQRQLAKLLSISKTTINAKINGKVQFDVEEAKRVCEILGVNSAGERAELFLM